jgi:hypothetical protein
MHGPRKVLLGRARRSGIKEPNHRHRWLLCLPGERPCGRCAAEQKYELAPFKKSLSLSLTANGWRRSPSCALGDIQTDCGNLHVERQSASVMRRDALGPFGQNSTGR